jgi:hypothetical protein
VNKLILISLLSLPLNANANEVRCLANILYSESRGESVEGIVAVGQAAVSRSKRTGLSICHINGVTRKRPPDRMRSYWYGIARNILADKQKPIVADADSWVKKGNKLGINHKDSKIRRIVDGHTFYLAGGKLI